MSIEKSLFVRIPSALGEDIMQLNDRAKACLARGAKLSPGDRTEAIRFDNLHATIDQIALAVLSDSAAETVLVEDTTNLEKFSQKIGTSVIGREDANDKELPKSVAAWLKEGSVAVELYLPHGRGETLLADAVRAQPARPAKRWQTNARRPSDAIKDRFEDSIVSALTGDDADIFISPSGVSNRVLTDTLHKYSKISEAQSRMDVPVVYRDGSNGPDFPLRALKLTEKTPKNSRVMKFSLLSIRHVEMDTIVDGAWLRNSRISRNREAGLTDQIVFEISKKQLLSFDPKIPVTIEMYQTGLEPAILGFYRAVALHLLKYPGSISVLPRFFAGPGDFDAGLVWSV